jgi:hypothetical protein
MNGVAYIRSNRSSPTRHREDAKDNKIQAKWLKIENPFLG